MVQIGFWRCSGNLSLNARLSEILIPELISQGASVVDLGLTDSSTTSNPIQILLLSVDNRVPRPNELKDALSCGNEPLPTLCLFLSSNPDSVRALVSLSEDFPVHLYVSTPEQISWITQHPSGGALRDLPLTFLPLCGLADSTSYTSSKDRSRVLSFYYPDSTPAHRDLELIRQEVLRRGSEFTLLDVQSFHEVKNHLSHNELVVFYPNWERVRSWHAEIAEAMLAGCAVIGPYGRSGSPEPQLRHGETGFRCRSTEEYLETIEFLFNTPSEIKAHGVRAASAAQQWSPKRAAKLILS